MTEDHKTLLLRKWHEDWRKLNAKISRMPVGPERDIQLALRGSLERSIYHEATGRKVYAV